MAKRDDPILKRFHEAGIPTSTQRYIVLQALQRCARFVTAQHLAEIIMQQHPTIHRGTIHRTLDLFAAKGVVIKANFPGEAAARWQVNDDMSMAHVICPECESIFMIEDQVLQPFALAVHQHYGVALVAVPLTLFGRCATCTETDSHVAAANDATAVWLSELAREEIADANC